MLPRRMPTASAALAVLALAACLLGNASARKILQGGCNGQDYSIDNGVTSFNFVCASPEDMIMGTDGIFCIGEMKCYQDTDADCTGATVACPTAGAPTTAPTPAPTDMAEGCTAIGASTNNSPLYNYICHGNLTIGDALNCDRDSACYAADDMNCSGTAIDCPTGPSRIPYKYYAYLKGKNSVTTTKIVTKTWGWGWVEWSADSTKANVTVEVKDGVDMFAAHIHNCSADCNGPVYVTIFDFTDAAGVVTYLSGAYTISIMVDLVDNPKVFELVMSGNAYVNVHTKAYPAGEVRGQLKDANAPTIVSVATVIPELAYFAVAVANAPDLLTAASDPTTAATVFAPSNAAFEAAIKEMGMSIEGLIDNTALLMAVLAYHVHTPTVYMAADAPAAPGINISTFLYDAMLHVEATNGTVMVSDAKVIRSDISVNNYTSVIHIIDKVLTPPMFSQTIMSVATDIPQLAYFAVAVFNAPELRAAASDPTTEATVFAPSNAAFEAAIADMGMSIDGLINNTALLTAILSYHVHTLAVYLAADAPAAPGINITTLLGDSTSIRNDNMLHVEATNGTVMVNDAKVFRAYISVNDNTAVILIIDKVLIPPIIMK
ncbi:hypothetical protein FOA52_001709 [Chlamydomonas sp. UWO 241]|nr:hypothetical protein FOA52_001709 [Chlamydomonas sp. UWO 241]